jgi:hypothetical protein
MIILLLSQLVLQQPLPASSLRLQDEHGRLERQLGLNLDDRLEHRLDADGLLACHHHGADHGSSSRRPGYR